MIRQARDSFQLSINLTENNMREITRIKPLVPRLIATSIVVVMLILGVGNQYLASITGSVFLAAAQADEPEKLTDANKGTHFITLSANTNKESGRHLAEGNFYMMRTDTVLVSAGFGTQGVGENDPNPVYMLMNYILHPNTDVFRFPLVIGAAWTQKGYWDSQVKTTLEGYEQIEVAAGTFQDCLKHKTVFTEAKAGSPLRSSLVNGTRYLWFAKGVGAVKMRYEHSNGTITEAELLESDVPVKGGEYFPLQVGNIWTYKWQNDYRDGAIIEQCQVIENTDKSPIPDLYEEKAVPESERMVLASAKYEVTIDGDERRVAHVRGILTPKEDSGETLLLFMSTFGTERLDDGYARYLRDLTVTGTDKEKLPIEKLGKTRWAVKVKDKAPVTLSYKVLLNHDERQWPPGRSETPYVQEDCIFCPGYALFVVSKVDNIELHIDVPNNWYVSTPWHRIGDKGNRFAVKDQDNLIYAYMVLGTHSEKVAKSEEAEVVIAVGGGFKEAATEIQGTVEAFLKAYSGVFNGTPKGRMLFVANPYGERGRMGGGVSKRSISVLIGGTLEATKHLWIPLVGHEVFHIWNGTAITFAEQEYWFSEGFTEYYSRIISARLGFTSDDDFLKNLERTCELYLSKQGELSIRGAGTDKSANMDLVYQGGNLIAAALDVRIRKLTQNQKSLDDVMKQMYREFGVTGETYTVKDVIRIVSDIANEDFEPFFRKYVSGTERLPLAEYFEDAGLNIEMIGRLPDLRYVLKKMLRIQSLTQTPMGNLIIHKSPAYQDEDDLVAINGTPVNTFNDIRGIAKGWSTGDVVKLTLERDSETITLPVTLGGTSEKPPIGLDLASVTISKMTNSTSLQRAILSSILGDNQ